MAQRLFGLLLSLIAMGVGAAPMTLQSSLQPPAVVELFTSHGCSSCPPADAWLRRLSDQPGLWSRFIPLAFHVDYWDGLGWPDRFASPRFSQRQRDYRAAGAIGSVYTPGMLLNGKEWRSWLWHRGIPEPEAQPVGRLTLHIDPGHGATLVFLPMGANRDLTAHLAILGCGLSSPIGAGENRGKTLKEDFVVLGMSDGQAIGATHWNLGWPTLSTAPGTAAAQSQAQRLAVVAWVEHGPDPRPIQAVGAWLTAAHQ